MDIYKCPIFRKSKENPNRVFLKDSSNRIIKLKYRNDNILYTNQHVYRSSRKTQRTPQGCFY